MKTERVQLVGRTQPASFSERRSWNLYVVTMCCAISCALCFAMFAPLCSAQVTEGGLTGTVTSSDGALIAGATVTVINQGTQFSRMVIADSHGTYSVAGLNPGSYTVKVDAPGFGELQHRDVALEAAQTVRVDAALAVGTQTTEVNVTGDSTVLNLEMPSISSTVSTEALSDTSSNLLGTSDATGDSGLLFYTTLLPGGTQAGTYFDWSMYGSRGNEAYYSVDGISSNSALYGNMVGPSLPPFGMVQEVEYSSVNNKAELGQVFDVSIVTKSGTNAFHGDGFENYGTDVLQAPGYFAAGKVGTYTQNDFGADVGGPILKNKWQNLFYPTSILGQSQLGPYPQHVYTNRFYGRFDYSLSKNNTLFARVGYVRSSPEVLDSGLPPSITGYRVRDIARRSGTPGREYLKTPGSLPRISSTRPSSD